MWCLMMLDSTSKRRRILAAASVSYVVVVLDTSIVNVALDRISTAFTAPVEGLQWVLSGYTLCFAALLLTGGWLGDRWGARNVYLIGLGTFTLASMLCGIAMNLPSLVAARAAQGVGAALLVPCSLKLIDHANPDPADRARAIGLWAVFGAIAMAAGPLIGGVLIDLLGWRSIFFVNVPIGIAGMAMTWRVSDHARSTERQSFDIVGQATAIIGLVSTIGVLIEGQRAGWTSQSILIGIGLIPAAWSMFLIVEARQSLPMLPLQLFRSLAFSGCVYVSAASAFIFYGLLFILSLTFQQTRHYTPLSTGLALLPMTVMVALGSLSSAAAVRMLGARRSMCLAFALYACGGIGLLLAGTATSYWHMVPALLAIGSASGFISPAATAPALGAVEKQRIGIAAGALNAARQSGAALGVAVFGSLIAAFDTPEQGLRFALWAVVLVSIVSALIWWAFQAARDTSETQP